MKIKSILAAVLFCLFCATVNAQTSVQATIVNTSPQKASVYAKPNSALSNKIFLQIAITLSIPDQGPNNPVVTVDSNYVNNLTWSVPGGVSNPTVYNGRAYYTFNGDDNSNNVTTSWDKTTNSGNKVATFGFSNSFGLSGLQMNDELPAGGPNFQMFFYIIVVGAENDVTNYPSKFYGVNPLPVNNENTPSSVGAQAVSLLPVTLKDFNVSKQGSTDALLTWTTAMEQNVSHFILERSANGSSAWSKFADVKAKGNSNTPTTYTYSDAKVFDGASATKTVFYRVKSVDLDGQEKIFPIRSLRFSATGAKEIGLYPNPAKEGFTLSVPLVNPQGAKIRLNLINRLGQIVHGREIPGTSASNYYYDIKTPGVISGEYMLQILLDGELLDTKKVIVQR